MQIVAFTAASLAALGIALIAPRPAWADPAPVISGPHVHENLAVYFVHGPSAPGPVPLTLQEALAKGSVRVVETGEVNELKVENTGDDDVFIQSGDIVKGGQQDRVLTMSFVLPPKSGEVGLAAFCVEHGRWSARGTEDVKAFASATEAMPSRKAKLAMRAPREATVAANVAGDSASSDTYTRQQEVWASVASTQGKLSENLSAAVAAPSSETSLQLSLENEQLQKARAAYTGALQAAGEGKEDIIGYVLAINGRIVSADVYPSNALYRKMWGKQLAAGVTEAIGEANGTRGPVPAQQAAAEFLKTAEGSAAREETVNGFSRQAVHDADKALYVEAQRGDGSWVHRNYLAK
jgi:ARG/rhodanese/phosphatase superfamily protein